MCTYVVICKHTSNGNKALQLVQNVNNYSAIKGQKTSKGKSRTLLYLIAYFICPCDFICRLLRIRVQKFLCIKSWNLYALWFFVNMLLLGIELLDFGQHFAADWATALTHLTSVEWACLRCDLKFKIKTNFIMGTNFKI